MLTIVNIYQLFALGLFAIALHFINKEDEYDKKETEN